MKLVVFWLLGVPLAVALMLGGFSINGQIAAARSGDVVAADVVAGDVVSHRGAGEPAR